MSKSRTKETTMMHMGKFANPLTGPLLAVMLAAMAIPSAVAAQGTQAEAQTLPPAGTVVDTSRTSSNGFDWLAKTRTATPPPVTVVRQIGEGSYICAPAGFGRKSRCYSN
jgi:hypothetical protein